MALAAWSHVGRCASNSTVVATVASSEYAPALLKLGASAKEFGFPCVLVQPMDPEALIRAPVPATLLLLPVPQPALLPRRQWCGTPNRYGSRRAQLYRVRLWREVLQRGLDLLAVDATLRLTASPLPHLHHLVTSLPGRSVDVLGAQPGWGFSKAFKTTAMWLRSTAQTRTLLRHVENRTFGGLDSTLLSEELNFSPRFADISCCHTPCLSSLFEHGAKPAKRDVLATPLRCRDDAPPAAPPPLASRLRWSKPWRPDADNDARFLGSALRFGRCTAKENACELRGRPSSATPYPSGAGWASCLVNKHRQHVPGRKPPSTLATVTNIVSRLTPTLLPHRTSARKLSQ